MDQMVIAVVVVVTVGGVGLFAALRAAYQIGLERDALRRGRAALRNLAMGQDEAFNYRDWLAQSGAGLVDSHFADHLLAAANATKSGRTVSLHELHEISARREARRIWARLSGGVTALLLVCGIAGTLVAIKPVLGDFALDDKGTGTTEVTINIKKATELIQGLSTAFLPSLVALIGTLVVASARGWYAHGRGVLAGELDHLDLEDLFARFPPPSLSRELDGVRGQLADLTSQMLASQRNLDRFVQRLTDSANLFHSDAPPLQAASKHFVAGVKALSPSIDGLRKTIAEQLGANSPLVSRFDGLLAVSTQVTDAAAQMQLAAALLSKHLPESHQLLKDTADALPLRIQTACESATSIIANATAKALADACTAAVQRLDEAAAPLRDAARSIAGENHALKADTSQAIAVLTAKIQALCDATTQAMKKDINKGLDDVKNRVDEHLVDAGNQVKGRLDQAEQAFKKALNAAVATISGLHSTASDAIAKVAETVSRMELIQPQINTALHDSGQTRHAIGSARDEISASSNAIADVTKQLDGARKALAETQQVGAVATERLAGLTAYIGKLTDDSNTLRISVATVQQSQQDTTARIEALAIRAEQMDSNWQRWQPEATRLQQAGVSLNANLERLLDQSREVTVQLARGATEAAEQQQRLAQDIAALTTALTQIERLQGASLFGRLFGNRE